VAPLRTSWRRRPLLVLVILLALLVIGYAARALDGDSLAGSRPAGPYPAVTSYPVSSPAPATWRAGPSPSSAQPAQDGGRLAAKAAMPSCACGPAK
jgi:hypothetical protein